MDERRKYFRIKNNGDILAKVSNHPIEIVDISAASARVVYNSHLSKHGTMAITIHNFTLYASYDMLRTEKNDAILIFKNQSEINQLFTTLKHLRGERETIKLNNQHNRKP